MGGEPLRLIIRRVAHTPVDVAEDPALADGARSPADQLALVSAGETDTFYGYSLIPSDLEGDVERVRLGSSGSSSVRRRIPSAADER